MSEARKEDRADEHAPVDSQRHSPDTPSVARMYDYFLGGFHNFEIDRQAARAVIELYPDTPLIMQANRAFLRRAVTFLCAQGIDQFLDLGSGVPTVGNVHEVAHKINPAARVVYVDVEPIAVRHTELILRDIPNAGVLQADVREPEAILEHPEVQRLLDLHRPLAVMLVAVLHYIPDDNEAYRAVRMLRDAVVPGSYLAIAHGTHEHLPPEIRARGEEIYARTTHPIKARSAEEIARFFEGLDLVEPGMVYVPLWRPEDAADLFLDEPERSVNFVGVGRKPAG